MAILVVDDEKDVRESLGEILRGAGYKVATAASGKEALDFIHKHRVSMMLVDMSMPGMSGEELLMRLEQDRRRPPALVITALAPWKLMGLMQQGVGYLRKPINTYLLLNVIESFMGKDGGNGSQKTC
jgi:CheY-like chemotaxis protein